MRELPNTLTTTATAISRSTSASSIPGVAKQRQETQASFPKYVDNALQNIASKSPKSTRKKDENMSRSRSDLELLLARSISEESLKNNLNPLRVIPKSKETGSENSLTQAAYSKAIGISALEFLSVLDYLNSMQSRFRGRSIHSHILVIDVRDSTSYDSFIYNSISIHLPSILRKRIRKGMVSKVPLEGFLSDDSKLRFQEWSEQVQMYYNDDRAVANETDCDFWIIVYDDGSSEEGETSEPSLAASYAHCLSEEFSSGTHWHNSDQTEKSLIGKRKTVVSFVEGGFHSIENTDGMQKYIRTGPRTGEGSSRTSSVNTSLASLTNSFQNLPMRTRSRDNISDLSRLSISNLRAAAEGKDSIHGSQSQDITTGTPMSPKIPKTRKMSQFTIDTTVQSKMPQMVAEHQLELDRKHTNMDSGPGNFELHSPPVENSPTMPEPMTQILPFLYLGSDHIPASSDASKQLKTHGITHILNMAKEITNSQLEQDEQFVYKWIKLDDNADQDADCAIKEAVEFIAQAHEFSPNAKVLVHCRAGKSRSATAVIAYLIFKERMSLEDARSFVRKLRPQISPNIGFWVTLQRVEKEMMERRKE